VTINANLRDVQSMYAIQIKTVLLICLNTHAVQINVKQLDVVKFGALIVAVIQMAHVMILKHALICAVQIYHAQQKVIAAQN